MASDAGAPVDLYIYDLTQGFASLLSPAILGSRVEGVWHTAVVVYDREYFFGAGGVTCCDPGSTVLGAPLRVERLGETFVPARVFLDYLHGLATTTYAGSEYRLLEHNCNHFSDEVGQFLCGGRVPKHILDQGDILPPAIRTAVTMLLSNMQNNLPINGERRRDSPDYDTLNNQIEEARAAGAVLQARRCTLAEKEARRERRRRKRRQERGGGEMAEAVEAAVESPCAGAEPAGPSVEPQEEHGMREPPILYTDFDDAAEYDALVTALGSSDLTLTPEEEQNLQELQQYMTQDEGSWVLGDDFLAFIGRLLQAGGPCRTCVLRVLGAAALRADLALLLHQDRRHHALLAAAHGIDRLPAGDQLPLTIFMCNLFSHVSSSEWLLYISEWDLNGYPVSNIRVTTKVCVHALLSAGGALREAGAALLHNIAHKERLRAARDLRSLLPTHAKSKVFDEVAVELCMAALQLAGEAAGAAGEAGEATSERALLRTLRALGALAQASREVPALIAAVGPSPDLLRGRSPQIDEQIDIIMKTMKQ